MLNKLLTVILLGSGSVASAATPFPRPSCLEPAIEFWTQIDSEYSKDQVVIHDKDTYEILDVVEITSTNKKARQGQINAKMHYYQNLYPERNLHAQTGIKERFEAGIQRSIKLLPSILRIFKTFQLPRELALLPHVESSFDPRARSKVNARGIWQIMPGTAKMFGVRSKQILHDPIKSSALAAKIIRAKFEYIGGHWPLAVTAYNHGEAGVKRAMIAVGSSDICEIIEKYKGSRFGFASKNFYAQFITIQELTVEHYQDIPAWNDYPTNFN